MTPRPRSANIQNFIAEGVDLILLTPMGEGTVPAIIQANEAGVPVIEVNNRAGFGSEEAEVVTYVGADDVEFGRQQARLLDQTYGGEPAKIGYVMGIPGTRRRSSARRGSRRCWRSTPSTRSSPR